MKKSTLFFLVGLLLVIVLAALAIPSLLELKQSKETPTVSLEMEITMNLTSSAFSASQSIPERYSCKGADVSPPLAWDEPPAGTQSFALIIDDPDAPVGTWDHWVLFNIPTERRDLPDDFQPTGSIVVGRNSWGRNDYGGPCPPSGTHRYFFRLYALDTTLSLSGNVKKMEVLTAIQGHVLGMAELMGTFSK
jgi:Raf kinase inhibitor-like YbhB/YbcL family protein